MQLEPFCNSVFLFPENKTFKVMIGKSIPDSFKVEINLNSAEEAADLVINNSWLSQALMRYTRKAVNTLYEKRGEAYHKDSSDLIMKISYANQQYLLEIKDLIQTVISSIPVRDYRLSDIVSSFIETYEKDRIKAGLIPYKNIILHVAGIEELKSLDVPILIKGSEKITVSCSVEEDKPFKA